MKQLTTTPTTVGLLVKYIVMPAMLAAAALPGRVQAQSTSSALIDKLEQKGILTADEAKQLQDETAAADTNLLKTLPASKLKISKVFKNAELYGDMRFRYEYRSADNVPGAAADTFARERDRYALRVGVRGDLYDDFYYGVRLDTANNPRSPWNTFGNNTTAGSVTPSDKNASGIYLGQMYLGWKPADWAEITIGRMPMPLYTTPMIWDSDINPEGAYEKVKFHLGNADLFAGFAQIDYQDPSSSPDALTDDAFLLAVQAGGSMTFSNGMFFKAAPVLYAYVNDGASGGLNQPYVGQGKAGANVGVPGGSNVAGYNEEGINDLLVLDIPAEFSFKIKNTPFGNLRTRVFGDFAYNIEGDARAHAAYYADPAAFPGVHGPVNGQNKAYQVGIGIGSDSLNYGPTQGLVYGSACKKGAWEARFYWQHVEQYALDVNLMDSDFFEGRANLQGFYAAFAYGFTDAIIGTVRYGNANPINGQLGTGGNNLDLPGINPIKNYNVLQLDLTWRF